MAKGRRRKPGPRTKSGRLSRAKAVTTDRGTAQLQSKRQALVGEGNDPVLSATAVGTLHAAGILDVEQYNIALRYRSLRSALYGPPWPGNTIGNEIDPKRIARLQREYNALRSRLTEDQCYVVGQVCVFDHRPMWWFSARLNLKQLPEDHRERELLLTGLDALLERRNGKAA